MPSNFFLLRQYFLRSSMLLTACSLSLEELCWVSSMLEQILLIVFNSKKYPVILSEYAACCSAKSSLWRRTMSSFQENQEGHQLNGCSACFRLFCQLNSALSGCTFTAPHEAKKCFLLVYCS